MQGGNPRGVLLLLRIFSYARRMREKELTVCKLSLRNRKTASRSAQYRQGCTGEEGHINQIWHESWACPELRCPNSFQRLCAKFVPLFATKAKKQRTRQHQQFVKERSINGSFQCYQSEGYRHMTSMHAETFWLWPKL